MTLPLELTMPEAVRISVSMRSFSTKARDGNTALSSFKVAECQSGLTWARTECVRSDKKKRAKSSFIEVTLFEMNEATLNSDGRGVCAVADAKLAQQVIDVGFDGSFGDSQVRGDFLVGATGDDALEHR